MTYYWLSFVDNSQAEGERFVGGCLVEADDPSEALQESWRYRCNPGGEVAIVKIQPEYAPGLAKFKLNYLYNKQEIISMGEYRTIGDMLDERRKQ